MDPMSTHVIILLQKLCGGYYRVVYLLRCEGWPLTKRHPCQILVVFLFIYLKNDIFASTHMNKVDIDWLPWESFVPPQAHMEWSMKLELITWANWSARE